MDKKQDKEKKKQLEVLDRICNECGRKDRIPIINCNICWKDMNNTFFNPLKIGAINE